MQSKSQIAWSNLRYYLEKTNAGLGKTYNYCHADLLEKSGLSKDLPGCFFRIRAMATSMI
jgi:hypothetical protein